MPTKIISKKSSTASSVPIASDLEVGEIAVNTADKKQYTKHTDNSIVELGTNPSTLTLDGTLVTSTAAELNKLDGLTATTAELNILDGITSTTTELNYTDGVTSPIQSQLNAKAPLANPNFIGTPTITDTIVHSGDSNTSFGFPALDTFAVNTTGSERMRITNAGNVGIGTSNPSYNLDIVSLADTSLSINAGNAFSSQLYFGDTANGVVGSIIYDHTDNSMNFATATIERMTIDVGGNVGIGTTSPSTRLEVTNNVNNVARIVQADTALSNNTYAFEVDSSLHTSNLSTAGAMAVDVNSGRAFTINGLGSVGIGTSSPVYALDVVNTASTLQTIRIGCADTGVGRLLFGDVASANRGNIQYDHTSDSMALHTVGTERMRIDSVGNVGIGTTAPSSFDIPNFVVSKNGAGAGMTLAQAAGAGDVEVNFSINPTFDSRASVGCDVGASALFFKTATSERMRIASTGNVGIGTSDTASGKLTIDGGINSDIALGTGFDYNVIRSIRIGNNNHDLAFGTNHSGASFVEFMRIAQSGNVGIGTTSPDAKLEVVDDIEISGLNPTFKLRATTTGACSLLFGDSSSSNVGQIVYSHASNFMNFVAAGAERMRIDSTGNIGIGTTAPRGNLSLGYSTSVSLTSTTLHMGYASSNFFGFRLFQEQQAGSKAAGVFSIQRGTTTAWEDALTISDAGNVGVGTTAPTSKLEIYEEDNGNTANLLGLYNFGSAANTNAEIRLAGGNGLSSRYTFIRAQNLGASSGNGHNLLFGTNLNGGIPAERMRIDSSGSLLVGCTSLPSASVSGAAFEKTASGVDLSIGTINTSADRLVAFYNPNGLVGSIVTSALTTSYNTASDERLKENIVDAPSASTDIDAVQVRQFDWKADGSRQEYGFIAQELKEVAPYAVTTPESEEEMMSVDYSKLVPMMMKELQELRSRVAELENKGV